MQEHDDGPSDPAKVSATISAALASGLIKLPGAEALDEDKRTNRKLGVILDAMGTASIDWTRTVPHNLPPEDLAALDRFAPVPREAIESAGTAPGEVMCHCSEDDGVPDVGVSVGLGNDRALWIGDLLERDGATCGVVFHGLDEKGERTRIVAPFADGTDWQEVADLFRHHVGPAIGKLIERERFDVTKRPDVRQNALLAAEVITAWAHGKPNAEFTPGDGRRAIGSIRQLLAAHDDMEVHRDAARDALSDMRDERDRLQLYITESEAQPVTHATRPEVEILLAGRHDLMVEVETIGALLREPPEPGRASVEYDPDWSKEVANLLDRLGAYIVGQDTRLIAAGEALETERVRYDHLVKLHDENGQMLDKAQARVDELIAMTKEAQAERRAAVADRDKADAAHGCAVRDYRAQLAEEVDAHRRTVASLDWVQEAFERKEIGITLWGMPRGEIARQWVEGLKDDVRSAEKGFEEERAKRIKVDEALKDAELHSTMLEMRVEAAIHELRIGSDPMSVADYLTPALQPGKPRFRVVTSPRFYSEADRERAADAFEQDRDGFWIPNADRYRLVDILAATLGMQRAAS